MKPFRRLRARALTATACVALAIGTIACSGRESDEAIGQQQSALSREQIAINDRLADEEALAKVLPVEYEEACPTTKKGVHCLAKVVKDSANLYRLPHEPPAGALGAADLQDAYKLPKTGGNGRIVAIIDAFDAPNAERDLNVYRMQYGIPPCTTANGCFRKVNQDGNASPLPAHDRGWATEINVDLQTVSATCPDCKLILCEARTAAGADLGPCVATAARLGAFVITNSYIQPESEPDSVNNFHYYNQPTAFVLAASGDHGYLRSPSDDGSIKPEVGFPASSQYVLSVGGTTLTRSPGSARGWAERSWGTAMNTGPGSGCSKIIPKPAWQNDATCTKRMVADVSAVADPATGVAFYDDGKWSSVGGTSIASPIVAGIVALLNVGHPSWAYGNRSAFFDITMGQNGSCGSYHCTAGAGYDGPTGLGTPNGAAIALLKPDGGMPTTGAGGAAGAAGAAGAGGAGGAGQGGRAGAGGADPGTGGSAGAGGSTGTAGAGGSVAGAGGSTSSSTTSTSTGAAGSATGSTSSTTTGAAGATTTTSSASATTGGNPPGIAQNEGGCSCRLGAGSNRTNTDLFGLLASALIGLAGTRRRARSRSVVAE